MTMKRALPLFTLGASAGLSACVGAPVGGMQSAATAEVFSLTRDGHTYSARVQPGQPGRALTADGAVATSGMTVVVSGDSLALGMDQGRLAKSLSVEACTQAGGRPNAAALGRYAAGQWQFAGACA